MMTSIPLPAVRPAVGDSLAYLRRQVGDRLRKAVGELAEPVRQIASYHFGWTTPDGRPADHGSGKMLRAEFVLASAHAVGGAPEAGLPGAVAVELVHNSTLLKDDVMDGDRLRRHRPTGWTVFGQSEALMASDALLVLAFNVLLRDGGPHTPPATQLLADAYQHLVVGQTLDIEFESRPRVTVIDYVRMAEGKTAALLGCATEIGAVLAGGGPAISTSLRGFGRHVGLAFQFVDDVLGIWGDPETTGKPVGADIRARKKSLPISYALTVPDADATRYLAGFYARANQPTDDEVRQVTAALDAIGARHWAEIGAQEHFHAANEILDDTELSGPRKADLLDLARRVVTRTC